MRFTGYSRSQIDYFGRVLIDQQEVLVRMRFLLAAVLLLWLRGVGWTLATALGAVQDPIGCPLKRQGLVATRLASRSGATPRVAKACRKTGSR